MFCCSPSPHATNLFNLEEAKQNEWVQKIAKIISRIWDLRHTLKQKQEEGQRGFVPLWYICEVWHGCRLLCCYFTLHWTWWKTARWVFEGGMGSHLDCVCVCLFNLSKHTAIWPLSNKVIVSEGPCVRTFHQNYLPCGTHRRTPCWWLSLSVLADSCNTLSTTRPLPSGIKTPTDSSLRPQPSPSY